MARRIVLPPRLSSTAELEAALAADDEPLVLVGTDVFCLGLDPSADFTDAALAGFVRVLLRLRTFPQPCVALVDGDCLGGGLGLAAACDLVLATERARFGLPEALVGMVPGVVWPVLAERVPAQRLRLLALRGGSVGAEEAVRLGLADVVVPRAQAEAALRRELRQLGRAAPASVQVLKHTPNLREALEQGARVTAERLRDPAVAQAMAALAAGEPAWETR